MDTFAFRSYVVILLSKTISVTGLLQLYYIVAKEETVKLPHGSQLLVEQHEGSTNPVETHGAVPPVYGFGPHV